MSAAARHIYVIRHCQSEANVDGRLEALGDSPLTAMGVYQAKKLAEAIAALELSSPTVISSPLQRASATANHIASVLGCEPVHDYRLREGEVGWMEGFSQQAVEAHLKEKDAKFLNAEMHGGETFEAIAERTVAALTEHLAATEGPLLIVCHGYATRALLWRLYGEDAPNAPRFQQPFGNGDMIAFRLEGGRPAETFVHHVLAV